MTHFTKLEVVPEIPWYLNRKFIAPITAALATVLVLVLQEVWPVFAITASQLTDFLSFIWTAAVAILIGDMGFDWIGQITNVLRLVLAVLEARQEAAPRLAQADIDRLQASILKELRG